VKAAPTGDQVLRPGVVRYLVTPELAGRRLDQGLAALAGVSRRRVRALVGEGRLWLNGRATRVLSRLLHLADVLDVVPEGVELGPPRPLPPPLSILHEDGWLLAVDKPAGVTTQPPRKRAPGELTAHETALLQLALREGRRVELRLFHRLDRLTTGVLVFARQHEAARALTRIWGSDSVRKRYVVLVRGNPGEGIRTLTGTIAPDPLVPGRFRIARGGKPARTEVRRLATSGEFSLVEARPATGRTHQVRVHLTEVGCPVAGDTLYGGGGGVPRPFLHAWRLSLPHPRTGQLLHLTAPVPADMQAFLAGLGFAADLLST
jgi:23S rRNA pseudouridine1911/1915/1917 synthase